MASIVVESLYSDSWMFNIIVTCAGLSTAGSTLFTLAKEDIVGEIGEVKVRPHLDSTALRRVELQIEQPADALRVIIYAIACEFPQGKMISVGDNPPFDMQVQINGDKGVIYSENHSVNRWGGASIELNLEL